MLKQRHYACIRRLIQDYYHVESAVHAAGSQGKSGCAALPELTVKLQITTSTHFQESQQSHRAFHRKSLRIPTWSWCSEHMLDRNEDNCFEDDLRDLLHPQWRSWEAGSWKTLPNSKFVDKCLCIHWNHKYDKNVQSQIALTIIKKNPSTVFYKIANRFVT